MAEVQNEGEDLGEVAPKEQQSDDSEVPLSTASTSASVMRKRKCPDNGKSDVDKVINFLELNSCLLYTSLNVLIYTFIPN